MFFSFTILLHPARISRISFASGSPGAMLLTRKGVLMPAKSGPMGSAKLGSIPLRPMASTDTTPPTGCIVISLAAP